MDTWSGNDWLTLRLGPLWALSALTGRCRFDADEQEAFWDSVTDLGLRTTGLAHRLLVATAADRQWLFDEFELDGRPIVSGLNAVTALLEHVDRAEADAARGLVLRIGQDFARARGPFGRRITLQDEQTLLLLEQLLEPSDVTHDDNPLNSHLPI